MPKDYLEEGDPCPQCEAEGVEAKMGYENVENCSCHLNPTCSACVDNPLVCLECGWSEEDA